jgi:hypothetical protein
MSTPSQEESLPQLHSFVWERTLTEADDEAMVEVFQNKHALQRIRLALKYLRADLQRHYKRLNLTHAHFACMLPKHHRLLHMLPKNKNKQSSV